MGSMVCANLDNDDSDADFDFLDDVVAGEDDLVKIVIRRPVGLAAGQVELRDVMNGELVEVWESPEKRNQVLLPRVYDVEELPRELWVEGVIGSSAPRDVVFEVRGQAADETPLVPDRVALTVVELASLDWIGRGNSVNDDDSLDADPHVPSWPGSLRVFPGARAPGGPPRDRVTIRVRLAVAPPEDLDIFLRAFDVDDPSPLDSDVDPNDDGSSGIYPNSRIFYTAEEDNRGSVRSRKWGFIAGEDASGVARITFPAGTATREVEFQVTMQPGDNFRVAATCDPDYALQLRNLDQEDEERIVDSASEEEIVDPGRYVTPVLTVWRRLHVERDSMRGFSSLDWWTTPNENTVTGRITAKRRTGVPCLGIPGFTVTVLTIDQRLEDANQYAGGAIFVEGPAGFLNLPVLANTKGAAPNFVHVCGFPAGDLPARFRLHDDDDDSILPRLPDTGWMQDSDDPANNLFAPAYVRPVYDGGGNPANDEQNVALDVNTLDAEKEPCPGRQEARTPPGPMTSGSRYVQSVFQGPFDGGLGSRDSPDVSVRAIVAWRTGLKFGDSALIYQETITDLAATPDSIKNGATRADIERATVVHEVGHDVERGARGRRNHGQRLAYESPYSPAFPQQEPQPHPEHPAAGKGYSLARRVVSDERTERMEPKADQISGAEGRDGVRLGFIFLVLSFLFPPTAVAGTADLALVLESTRTSILVGEPLESGSGSKTEAASPWRATFSRSSLSTACESRCRKTERSRCLSCRRLSSLRGRRKHLPIS
ncbi:MAG: hypothetical protein KatS3mg076_1990 [Candidatus Binatia bacterium]|nr:MAG: hypothetical protein KatS3mg076_1990 [Candidatus Binatia bacterium]